MMTLDEVRALLRRECEAAGSQAAWSQRHGLVPQYVSDVINGRREPGRRMLAVLGLERAQRVILYRRIGNGEKEKA